MATIAHCLFCFESLAAELEKREPIGLTDVEQLNVQYEVSREEASRIEQDGNPIAVINPSDDDLMTNVDGEVDLPSASNAPTILIPPIVSRLNVASPASRSSTSSTPLSISSATSSQAALAAPSTSSSTSSFFSLSRPSTFSRADRYPLFVTWEKVSGRGHKSLRGCIGTFEAKELSKGLHDYAQAAAFDDTRFNPISVSELPSLQVSVTLLTNFTPCSHALEWDIGTHGIKISFLYHGRRVSATYLPSVALEQGWSKDETMVSLMQKAGWHGRSGDSRKVKDLRVVRYEGLKKELGYAEWRQWRDWVDRGEC